jgi:hypothetical protein
MREGSHLNRGTVLVQVRNGWGMERGFRGEVRGFFQVDEGARKTIAIAKTNETDTNVCSTTCVNRLALLLGLLTCDFD